VAGYKSNHSRGVLSPHPGDPFHREEIVANCIISPTLGQLRKNIFENGMKYTYIKHLMALIMKIYYHKKLRGLGGLCV